MIKRTFLALALLSAAGFSEARAASGNNQHNKRQQFSALLALEAAGGRAHNASAIRAAQNHSASNRAALRAFQASEIQARRTAGLRATQNITDLDPAAVQKYDARLTRYLRRHGVVPPPATSALPDSIIEFRQQFNRARFTPGARVGGVFFTTLATPSVPGGFVNVFQFFPVFTLFGITS